MVNHGTGRCGLSRNTFSRLNGFRNEFLTETKAPDFSIPCSSVGIARPIAAAVQPVAGADRTGETTTYALFNLQERGTLLLVRE